MLALFIIFTVFGTSLVLFSLRKIPCDMVSGGTNSLVLSAACHVPTISKRKKPFAARQVVETSERNSIQGHAIEDASSTCGYQQVASIQGTDDVSEDLEPPGETTVSLETEAPSRFGQQQEVGEDELQLLSGEIVGDDEMALLKEVAMSKIKWGAMPASPGIHEDLD